MSKSKKLFGYEDEDFDEYHSDSTGKKVIRKILGK